MSKQLKPEEWIKLFRIYESLGTPKIWIEYAKYKKVTDSVKAWFIIKYWKFLEHNRNMNALISMSGKSPKKGTQAGHPKIAKLSMKFERNLSKKLVKMKLLTCLMI